MAGEYGREPCPDRILDDIGGAFSMGAVGGSAWHFIRGLKDSPRGERLLGGTQAVRINAPRIGGSFAVWGGLFSTYDCTLVHIRQKEDPWNTIAAGFLTGGTLQIRAGPRSALQSAIFGGIILGLIEGAGLMLNRLSSPLPQGQPPLSEPTSPNIAGIPSSSGAPSGPYSSPYGGPYSDPVVVGGLSSESPESAKSGGGGWFGGIFGGGGKKEEGSGREERSEILDSSPPPTPNFGAGDDSWLKSK